MSSPAAHFSAHSRDPLRPASSTVGVPHIAPPRDDEDALSAVRGSNVGSPKIEPDSIIPRFGKVSENDVQPPKQESCDVLHDDDARSKNASDARELEPQTAALTSEASALPSDRHVLAGKAAAEYIDAGRVGSDGSHVVVANGSRPVPREDAAAPLVPLTLPDRLDIETSVAQSELKAELKATDPTK